MQSKASTPAEYVKSLPKERQDIIVEMRHFITKHLPKGYEECMQYGMISYVVPLSRYPNGYRHDKKTPLPFLSLASQKNYCALYMMCVYGNPDLDKWFRAEYTKSGKKLDMGMGCLRFKSIDELLLPVLAELLKKVPVENFIEQYELARSKTKSGK